MCAEIFALHKTFSPNFNARNSANNSFVSDIIKIPANKYEINQCLSNVAVRTL